MAFKVQIGPPQIAIHQGQTVLITEPDGQINSPSEKGLFFLDTRMISNWAVYANGEPWELLNGGPITYYAARIFLTNRSMATESGIIPGRTLGFTISRWICGGMHEDLDITNNSMRPIKFQLEITVRCDFADLFEVKSGNIVRRGRITTEMAGRAPNSLTRAIPMATSAGLSSLRRALKRRRSTQTAGSASKWRSNPAKLGMLAFSIP